MKHKPTLYIIALLAVGTVSVNATGFLTEDSNEIHSEKLVGNGSKGMKPPETDSIWDNLVDFIDKKLS